MNAPRDISSNESAPDSALSSGWWRLLSTLLGASLWIQLFGSSLLTEFRAERPAIGMLVAYTLPVMTVLLAGLLHRSVLSLLVVPTSLVPGAVLMPERDLAPLTQPFAMVALGVTMLLYLMTASLRYGDIEGLSWAFERDEHERRLAGTYRGYIALRGLFLGGLFAALIWGIFLDPETAQILSETHTSGTTSAQLFMAVSLLFVWCIVAYTTFLVPLSNLEYDLRALRRSLDSWGSDDASEVYWRLALWLALALLGLLSLIALGAV